MIHVVITGSRDWPPEKAFHIWNALARIPVLSGIPYWQIEGSGADQFFTLHHGVCPYGGADDMAIAAGLKDRIIRVEA